MGAEYVIDASSGWLSAFVLIAAVSAAAWAMNRPVINTSRGQLALRGYDGVLYWTGGQPARGRRRLSTAGTTRYGGSRPRSIATASPQSPSATRRNLGGYCAYAVSRGYTADGDPNVWRIVDGRLYLNYSRHAQDLWEQDVPGNIVKGRRNWPGVIGK